MRIILFPYLLVIVLFMNIFAQSSKDRIIKIEEMSDCDSDISNHKEGDMAVCKIFFMESNGYQCIFFRLEDNNLRQYKGSYMTEEVYNQAWYHWENDTTIAVRLINSVTKEEQKIQVWGSGSVIGMYVEDKD